MNAKEEKALMTFGEFIERFSIARGTAYLMTSRGEIPHYKFGKRLYFDAEEIEQWLEKYHRGPRIEASA